MGLRSEIFQPIVSQFGSGSQDCPCVRGGGPLLAFRTAKDHATGTTFSTNATESFWRLFKNSVDSTHIHISAKHLDRYLGEFAFRSKFRQLRTTMSDLLVAAL
jgi:hypothetical protein